MLEKTLRIATRKSPLALWQAQYIKQKLMIFYPKLHINIVPIITRGDIIINTSLVNFGGKRLFVKELELAILENCADIAVHSLKDVPVEFLEGVGLVTVCKRDDPLDAFVSNYYNTINDLPYGAVVGTSSLRRQCQLAALRPDLNIRSLRGNINTRLAMLDAGNYDAIILATAGLKRLGLHDRICYAIPAEVLLPAVGQGTIGIEYRLDDWQTLKLLSVLNDDDTKVCVIAERTMNTYLKGNCQVPIGGYAKLEGDNIWLRGLVGSPDGSLLIRREQRGPRTQAKRLGVSLAKELLSNGAHEILQKIY